MPPLRICDGSGTRMLSTAYYPGPCALRSFSVADWLSSCKTASGFGSGYFSDSCGFAPDREWRLGRQRAQNCLRPSLTLQSVATYNAHPVRVPRLIKERLNVIYISTALKTETETRSRVPETDENEGRAQSPGPPPQEGAQAPHGLGAGHGASV